jgi:hypothetical protein
VASTNNFVASEVISASLASRLASHLACAKV